MRGMDRVENTWVMIGLSGEGRNFFWGKIIEHAQMELSDENSEHLYVTPERDLDSSEYLAALEHSDEDLDRGRLNSFNAVWPRSFWVPFMGKSR